MRPVTLTTTDASGGATTSGVFVVDTFSDPINIGFAVDVTGTVSVTVQHTFDDPSSGSALWLNHATVSGATADVDGNYAFPVRGIRVRQATGSGSTRTVIIQAGPN